MATPTRFHQAPANKAGNDAAPFDGRTRWSFEQERTYRIGNKTNPPFQIDTPNELPAGFAIERVLPAGDSERPAPFTGHG